MKKILYTLCSALLMLSVAACINDDFGQKGPESSAGDEVTLRFATAVPGLQTVQTRSVDPDGEGISMMWLFLYDENGYYLGHVKADALTYQAGSAGGTATGTFTATVTSSTRRIHFIANYSAADIDDSQYMGQHETEMIPQFTSTSGRLVYWGRETFASEGELTAFANGTDGRTVTLYRNQAAVTWNQTLPQGMKVNGFAICNTYLRGTVAPYHHDAAQGHDPFDFALDGTHDFVTLCTGDDLAPAPEPSDTYIMNEWGMRYIFEHDNPADNQAYVIFNLTTGEGTKYYKLFLQDANSEPYPIIRNHRYVFRFQGTPPASLGYDSFDEAKNGVAANNVWVTIDDELPTIGDGDTELSIEGETTRIYTRQQDEVIRFTYTGQGSPADGQVSATWITNNGLADENLNLQYSNGQGSVTVKLGQINDEPQYGTLQIKTGKYTRRIHIIYLKNFDFAPVWTSSSVPRREGEPVSIMFNIPDTYPEELYPIEVKISCNRFDANSASTNNGGALDVIQEATDFTTADGQTYERDWGYKYVFRVDKPGLHRVDFKTVVGDFTTDGDVEWFLEAPYFNTIRREIQLVSANRADQEILFANNTGTDHITVPSVRGYEFEVRFRLEGGTPSGTRMRVYVNTEAVEPSGESVTALGSLQNDASDAGPYYWYTVPNRTDVTVGGQGYYELTFRTKGANTSGYIRLAAVASDNNNNEAHAYKSAIITRDSQPPYALGFQVNGSSTAASVAYGTGNAVSLSLDLPDLSGVTTSSYTLFIQTEHLEPAPSQQGLTAVEGGYEYTVPATQSGNVTLQMQTRDIVSAEDITVSETSGNIAVQSQTVALSNPALTGTLVYNEPDGFPRNEPFVALETMDGTRIGYFTITGAQGQAQTAYSLVLYGEYEYTADEPLTVLYSPLNDSRRFICQTTVSELLTSPTLTLALQQ